MSNEFTRASVSDWEVNSLRVTAFPVPNADIEPSGWWRSTTETEPETVLVQAKLGQKQFQGNFAGGQLTLLLRPGRIDWLLGSAALDDQQGTGQLIPSVGRVDAMCSRFKELVDRWLLLSPPLRRLAFGAVISLAVSDRVMGYKKLAPYLPAVKIDPEGTRDLSYRINRPRMSQTGIKDLQINRLSTWGMAAFEVKAVSISGGQATTTPGERAFACRVELDINTAEEYPGNLVPEQLPATFKELVDLGVEIIEKGDVP
jgi:hypothetical protein